MTYKELAKAILAMSEEDQEKQLVVTQDVDNYGKPPGFDPSFPTSTREPVIII